MFQKRIEIVSKMQCAFTFIEFYGAFEIISAETFCSRMQLCISFGKG